MKKKITKKVKQKKPLEKKVCIVVITKDTVKPEVLAAIHAQDFKNWQLLVSVEERKVSHESSQMATDINCSIARENARKMALASDATHFLFLDSDVVLPPTALTEFTMQRFDVQGGWYRIKDPVNLGITRYACGRYIKDNFCVMLRAVEPSLVHVDMIGNGCLFLTRKATKYVHFEAGAKRKVDSDVGEVLLDESSEASLKLEKRFNLFMNGSVVCQHI